MMATEAPAISSMAQLFKMAFQGVDLQPLRKSLTERLQNDALDPAAWVDLSVLEQLAGSQSSGLLCQSEGLKMCRLYRSSWPASPNALRVLAFMTDGDVSTNTPLDFLLEGFDVVLYSLYLTPGSSLPDHLPSHDIAIVTVSESDQARPTLRRIEEELMPAWTSPVLNRPSRILLHARERLFHLLSGVPGLFMPPTVRLSRSNLHKLGNDPDSLQVMLPGAAFPLIARPIGSHAGNGLQKLDNTESIASYLATQHEPEFYLSPFVDYRNQDGLFRKYRIMWVDGRPFPVHMAIAEEWKVWYLNAGMASSALKRAEEEQFLSAFDSGFGSRHAQALRTIAERFGLDYFGIDCGELPDGRLLVFEGSVALAAHDMDPPDLYPYKSPQMQRLFRAFHDMLRRRSKQRTVDQPQ